MPSDRWRAPPPAQTDAGDRGGQRAEGLAGAEPGRPHRSPPATAAAAYTMRNTRQRTGRVRAGGRRGGTTTRRPGTTAGVHVGTARSGSAARPRSSSATTGRTGSGGARCHRARRHTSGRPTHHTTGTSQEPGWRRWSPGRRSPPPRRRRRRAGRPTWPGRTAMARRRRGLDRFVARPRPGGPQRRGRAEHQRDPDVDQQPRRRRERTASDGVGQHGRGS